MGQGARLSDPATQSARSATEVLVPPHGSTAAHVAGARRKTPLYRNCPGGFASAVRLVRCARVPRSATDRDRRDDDTAFGILHSRFHELWSLRLGTTHEDRPRYTPTTTFQTFPFPEGLTPDIAAAEYANDPRAIAIAEAARRLVELRDRWLNPPEWVEWVDEPVARYPKRAVPTAAAPLRELGRRTLTNLYNERPQWLVDAHAELDAAVATAYGWHSDMQDAYVLEELLKLNRSVT